MTPATEQNSGSRVDTDRLQASLLAPYEKGPPPPSPEYRWVYLWHWPLRAMHWFAAISIVALVITGLYIGRPYFMTGGGPSGFTIQYMRLTHFVFAAVLVTTGIVRLYWLFAGNRFERWSALFPVRPRDLRNMFRVVRYYLLIHPERGPHYLGHNPMQQVAYTFTYVVTFVLALTGFIMFGAANPDGFIATLTLWMAPYLGGLQMVRAIHHVSTWYFPMFFFLHVYLATRSDLMDRQGNMSAIISGGRFVPSDTHYVDG
jgi:Ni/Fe-hydrogenase 1 B-type cytochrome subunit